MRHIICAAVLLGLNALGAATTLELSNGSRLIGELDRIHDGKVHLVTDFAGTLEIPLAKVVRIESDRELFLRSAGGEVASGTVTSPEPGVAEVTSARGKVRLPVSSLASGWRPDGRDPIVVAEEKAFNDRLRKWNVLVGANLTGRRGNTDTTSNAINFRAAMEGPSDRLDFYGSYAYAKTNNVRSEDEIILGIRYTGYLSEKFGWFVRTEGERDPFESIQFRSTSAAGLTYRWVNEPRMELETSAGFSYRYEDYTTGGTNDFPGLDFGLRFGWQFAEWARLSTRMSYVPSIDDFGDYLLKQDSGVDMPLGLSQRWSLRIGLSHEYNSSPQPGRKDLDTTYYLRLQMNWR